MPKRTSKKTTKRASKVTTKKVTGGATKGATKKLAKRAAKRTSTKPAAKKPAAPQPIASKRRAAAAATSRRDPAVDALITALDHPLAAEFEKVRTLALGASNDVHEGVKWNSPSFRAVDWFAAIDVRAKDGVRLIFHTGAKLKDSRTKGVDVADPAGLLKWLAKDRALVTLGRGAELTRNAAAFQDLVRAWVRLLGTFELQGSAAKKKTTRR